MVVFLKKDGLARNPLILICAYLSVRHMHVPKVLQKKLDPKSKKYIFLGYGEIGEMGYHL